MFFMGYTGFKQPWEGASGFNWVLWVLLDFT